jgi:hypothetical protein
VVVKVEQGTWDPEHKYAVFTLDNGKREFFYSKEDAQEFMDDFEAIVVDKRSFKLKKDYLSFKKAQERGVMEEERANPVKNPYSTPTNSGEKRRQKRVQKKQRASKRSSAGSRH